MPTVSCTLYSSDKLLVTTYQHLIYFKPIGQIPPEQWLEGFQIGFAHWEKNYKTNLKKHTFWTFFKSLFEKEQCNSLCWLNDLTELEPLAGEHLRILQEFVKPKANNFYPPLRIAFVLHPSNQFVNMQAAFYQLWLSGAHNARIKEFHSLEKAKNWLLCVN